MEKKGYKVTVTAVLKGIVDTGSVDFVLEMKCHVSQSQSTNRCFVLQLHHNRQADHIGCSGESIERPTIGPFYLDVVRR